MTTNRYRPSSASVVPDASWTLANGLRVAAHASLLLAPAVVTGWACLRYGGTLWGVHLVVGTIACSSMQAMFHEGAHGNLARRPHLNRAASTLAAVVAFVPFATWRAYHLEHHAKAGTASDPEGYRPDWSPWRLLTFPFTQWRFLAGVWVWTAQVAWGGGPEWLRRPEVARSVRRRSWETLVAAGALVGAFAVWPGLRWTLLPCMVLGAVVSGVTLLPEHHGAPIGPHPNPLEVTVSVESGPLVRHVIWSSNYHAAHHLAPSVPARNLRRLDRLACVDQDPCWRWPTYRAWYAARFRTLRWTISTARPEEEGLTPS